jgi:hypothetical protein
VLRSPPKYSFTKSKLRFWRLRKPCNWHFLNRHSYCENLCEFIDTHYLEAAEKVSSLFQIYFLLFFLALPQKEPKKSGPLKPVSPRKPKFPAIAQGHERRPFWFSPSAGPESGQAAAPFRDLVMLVSSCLLYLTIYYCRLCHARSFLKKTSLFNPKITNLNRNQGFSGVLTIIPSFS